MYIKIKNKWNKLYCVCLRFIIIVTRLAEKKMKE